MIDNPIEVVRSKESDFSRLGDFPGHSDLSIYTGVNAWYRDQVISKSHEPHILKHTPKDAESRFTNTAAFEEWYEKGRKLFLLANSSGHLGGIAWYGKETAPDYLGTGANHTFAIRLYEGFTGRGLGKPFMRATLHNYMGGLGREDIEQFGGIWLETCDDNDAAMALYPKFGFEIVGNDKERVGMVLSPESIREILSDKGA
jgi:ribosomal protein S18 acetylase RimI-like enzyme